jgi:hypothetical protein
MALEKRNLADRHTPLAALEAVKYVVRDTCATLLLLGLRNVEASTASLLHNPGLPARGCDAVCFIASLGDFKFDLEPKYPHEINRCVWLRLLCQLMAKSGAQTTIIMSLCAERNYCCI